MWRCSNCTHDRSRNKWNFLTEMVSSAVIDTACSRTVAGNQYSSIII